MMFKRDALSVLNTTGSLQKLNLNSHETDEHDETLNEGMMGSASDYILIAMIVAMMICMAVCCLCLFCRSSHLSLCGWNFEISNRTASVNIDDLTELHEVVPLTPTTTEPYNICDIEKKLKSDPPPPKYSEVTTKSVLDRFRLRSKRRGLSVDEASITEGATNRPSDSSNAGKRLSEKRSLSSWFFQRSISYQPPRASTWKPSTCAKTSSCIEEESHHTSNIKQSRTLPKSASDCVFEQTVSAIEPSFIASPDLAKNEDSKYKKQSKSISSKASDFYKEHSSGSCDDEVFM